MIDSVLGAGTKSGYTFTLSKVDAAAGTSAVFAASAVPVTPPPGVTATGSRCFGISTDGVLVGANGAATVGNAAGALTGTGVPLNN